MNIQPSNLSASGTSFHGDTIRTTLNSIRKEITAQNKIKIGQAPVKRK